jgi:hypothetical protein
VREPVSPSQYGANGGIGIRIAQVAAPASTLRWQRFGGAMQTLRVPEHCGPQDVLWIPGILRTIARSECQHD